VLKLYKKEGDALHYWEAWVHEGELTVHWGKVGEQGQTRTQPLPPDEEDPDLLLASEAADLVDQGYEEPEPDVFVPLVLQYPLEGTGSAQDLALRDAVDELCTDILGWTGNGEVEGGEMKLGRMNLYLLVMDADVAVRRLVEALDEEDMLEGAVFAVVPENGTPRVLWPQGHTGTFQP
jgi:predicted DNA-binding WGR domain protein